MSETCLWFNTQSFAILLERVQASQRPELGRTTNLPDPCVDLMCALKLAYSRKWIGKEH